jgi:Flp pilus assembly protein TadD
VSLEPENTTYLPDLASSFNKLGGLDERTDLGKAREWFEQALEIRRRLVSLEPENTAYLRDLSVSFNRLGGLDARTDLGKAREWFEQALQIVRRLVSLEPNAWSDWYDIACNCARLGETTPALEALAAAIKTGYTNAEWAARDTDLVSLHGLPEFDRLLRLMRPNPTGSSR